MKIKCLDSSPRFTLNPHFLLKHSGRQHTITPVIGSLSFMDSFHAFWLSLANPQLLWVFGNSTNRWQNFSSLTCVSAFKINKHFSKKDIQMANMFK